MQQPSFAVRVIVGVAALAALSCTEKSSAEAPAAAPAAAKQAASNAPVPAASKPVPSATSASAAVAALGKPAPDFTLKGLDGKDHALSALKGKTVVLEWFNPECPFVRYAHTQGPLKDQAKRTQNAELVWLSINSNAPGKQGHGAAANRDGKVKYGVENPILLDESGAVGHRYGALKTPHMFIIDANGILVYRGGIDNAPIGTVDDERPRLPSGKPGEVINYVDTALGDLKAGKPIRLSDTPPYGCTVKYSS